MRKITAGLFIRSTASSRRRSVALPVFQRRDGGRRRRDLRRRGHRPLRPHDVRSFAGAWPEREAAGGEDAGFAKKLGDARKIVVSHHKLEFSWRNSEQLEGDLVETVTALKNEPGGTIASSGSVSVVRRAAGGRPRRRAAPVGAPDRHSQGHAAVRRGREPDPAEADLVGDLHDRRPEPRLRAGRVDRRCHLRGREGPPAGQRSRGPSSALQEAIRSDRVRRGRRSSRSRRSVRRRS